MAIGIAALLAAALDRSGAPGLLYVRDGVLAGEVWRLWSAHLVHFGLSHLGWNLLVLFPLGAWAERLAPARTRVFYAVAPALIGLTLLAGAPALHRYGGLSGLAAGLVVLLALAQFSGARGCDRWLGWTLLGAVAVKIAAESITGHAAFANLPAGEVRPVPLAHLAGALSAIALHLAALRLETRSARVRTHG
jgi:rhomboid family GlyGly-CTERM serine protease